MLFGKAKILRSHGWQYIPNLDGVTLTEEFRGFPLLSETKDTTDIERAAKICPTGALTAKPLTLDMGKCLFCGECQKCAPKNIKFTNEHRLAATRREDLVVVAGQTAPNFTVEAIRPEIAKYFGRALQLREVSAGGDCSVEMELNATGNVNFDFGRYGVGFTASPRHADGLVLTGPISANMAEALDICYNSIAEPKILVICGSEAVSGGLYAESPAVERSFIDKYHVDLWLPGAPTHPLCFIDGITRLRKRR
uniref:NADH-quinone oxidoreductase subunit B family protein n=1 Tax=Alistipes sp. TaxID=1872444 RepID=UPI0040572B32